MENLITTLVEVIREEEALLGEFLDLLEQQKTILVKNDLEKFERTAEEQEELIERIREAEKRRIEIVRSMGKGIGETDSEVTLTRLVEMSLGQVSDELANAKKNLNGLVSRIKRVNQVNQYLIKRSFNRTQKRIDWLIDGGEQDTTYESNGKLRNRETRSVLVNKTL